MERKVEEQIRGQFSAAPLDMLKATRDVLSKLIEERESEPLGKRAGIEPKPYDSFGSYKDMSDKGSSTL